MTAIPAEPQIVDEPENPLVRAPLVEGGRTFAEVTNLVAAPAEGATPRGWYLMFGVAIAVSTGWFIYHSTTPLTIQL